MTTVISTSASYDLSKIMSDAWTLVRQAGKTLSEALRAVWAKARAAVRKLNIDITKLTDLSVSELKDLQAAISATIAEKEAPEQPEAPKEPVKVLFNPENHFERYNGGWTKEVTGLDKSVTNGYSIEGDFTGKGRKEWYTVGKLYLDCGLGGSRKNQRKYYTLFTVDAEAKPVIIQEETGSDWATNLWAAIEQYLK